MEQKEVDKKIFSMSLALVAVFTVPTLINPEKGVHFLNAVLSFLIVNLGYFYLWGAFIVFVIVMYLCFSKYGKIKLGDSEPEFSTFSWIGMIFTATAGSSLVYWGFTEWIYYYTSPPFGMEPRSAEAAEWASTYGMYHWGVMGFVIYCLPTIVLAYAMYVRNLPSIRLSNACRGVLGDRVDGWVGQLIDVMFMFGIVGGIGTSLGLGTPMLAQGISELTGIPRSYKLDVAIIVIWVIIFSTSVYFGLKKGLKVLSDINVYFYFAFLLFFLILGPTLFIINKFTDSIGLLLQNFLQMSLYTDSIRGSTFAQDWTIFYWAWWFSLVPYMAMFTARISKGRTIRSVVLAMCLGGTLGCALAFAIFGNTAMYFELANVLPVVDILMENGAPVAIIEMVKIMPLGEGVLLGLFVVFNFIFLSTTMDSAAYSLAFISSKASNVNQEPARWIRLFWAMVLGAVAIILFYGGGLKALQTLSIITGFPILLIFIFFVMTIFKWLKEDFPQEITVKGETASERLSTEKLSA